MKGVRYDGWTNYATWRVNLEIIDNLNPEDFGFSRKEPMNLHDVMDAMKEWVEYCLEIETGGEGLAYNYALAFVEDVDYREIAENFISAYTEKIRHA